MINVTKTYLPPIEEYTEYLEGIWERVHLTNHGPLVTELEEKLRKYLGVKHLFFVSNGTIALQIAIKALKLTNEVITTPFSYVATTSSLVWEGCKPVFVDIHPETLCIDHRFLEEAITSQTTAIMATHVYGNPCEVEAIEKIAKKYHLPIIYDAAHAFGTQYKHKSILCYGDISTLSFHATKLFHTGEGGAVITQDDDLAHHISYLRNFGHNGPENFWGIGINGKNSELHAAMGLCILPKVPKLIEQRKRITLLYDELLARTILIKPTIHKDASFNYAYYPIIFPSEQALLYTKMELNLHQVFPRRYFYPSLNTLMYIDRQIESISEDISKRILCLPIYYDLKEREVEMICGIIIETLSL